jgi:hypothetical protein
MHAAFFAIDGTLSGMRAAFFAIVDTFDLHAWRFFRHRCRF